MHGGGGLLRFLRWPGQNVMSGKRRFRWIRWGAAALLTLTAAGACARLWLVEGWLRTVRIDGASMAPNFCGIHLLVTCSDCGIDFRCDGEHLPASGPLVCPNCGYRELVASRFAPRKGDTVYVDRWPLLTGGPRRGDVVAFRDPQVEGLSVKRVAGLPGEKLSIRDGDLYADGRIIRKSLAELRQVALLVHDNDHLPRSLANHGDDLFLRWTPESPQRGWQAERSRFRYQPTEDTARKGETAWLRYVHWRCDGSLTPRDEPAAILDNDPYNQAGSRQLHAVSDLLLTCRAQFPRSGQLTLSLATGKEELQVEIDAATGAIAARYGSQELIAAVSPVKLPGRRVALEFGQCDAQLLLGIDGRPVLQFPRKGNQDGSSSTGLKTSFRIGCAGGSFTLQRLKVWRDLHLLEPHGTDRAWTMNVSLEAGAFLLLGDNATVSIDGRHWRSGGIARTQMRGAVWLSGHKTSGP